jgi:hypothetical protein
MVFPPVEGGCRIRWSSIRSTGIAAARISWLQQSELAVVSEFGTFARIDSLAQDARLPLNGWFCPDSWFCRARLLPCRISAIP